MHLDLVTNPRPLGWPRHEAGAPLWLSQGSRSCTELEMGGQPWSFSRARRCFQLPRSLCCRGVSQGAQGPHKKDGALGEAQHHVPPVRSGDVTGTGSGGAEGSCAVLPVCCVCWAPAGVLLSTSGTFPQAKKGTCCWPTAAYTRVAAVSPCTPRHQGQGARGRLHLGQFPGTPWQRKAANTAPAAPKPGILRHPEEQRHIPKPPSV